VEEEAHLSGGPVNPGVHLINLHFRRKCVQTNAFSLLKSYLPIPWWDFIS
jgi:hypothetical protein